MLLLMLVHKMVLRARAGWFLGQARSPDLKPAPQARPAKARACILRDRSGPIPTSLQLEPS
jgi:hypothetical protein